MPPRRCLALLAVPLGAVLLGTVLGGCLAAEEEPLEEIEGVEVPWSEGKADGNVPLSTYLKRIPCTTEPIRGLSQQIIDELACMGIGLVEPIPEEPNLVLEDRSVMPYLEHAALAALRRASAGGVIRINSAMRTVAQQYLLHAWRGGGYCGIRAAALPGTSKHEIARAIDVVVTSAVSRRLAAAGWQREDSSDPVHFVYLPGAIDGDQSVVAFQRLWNRNHVEDLLLETGRFDNATIKRLRLAPSQGFPFGPLCTTAHALVGIGPDSSTTLTE